MAKANVNIEDVVVFRKSVEREMQNLNTISKNISSEIAEIICSIEEEERNFENVIEKCAQGINIVSKRINEEKYKISELKAKLSTIPSKIYVSVSDNAGGSYEVERPNPAYVALMKKINEIEKKISRLERKMQEFQKLKFRANEQKQILINVKIKIEEIGGKLQEYFLRLNMHSEEATKKLAEIEEVLYEYKETQIRRNF